MRRLGIIAGGIVLTLLLVAAPASALTIFGFSFGAAPAASTTAPQNDVTAREQVDTLTRDVIDNVDPHTCLQFTNHEYEVCTAYIFNSSMADLVPYYKYAHSANAGLARFVDYRLGSRYTGSSNTLIRDRVAAFPSGEFDVDVPAIKIVSVNASLATNSATLQTVESWRVTDKADNVIYQETDVPHTVTMARVPSYVLHKWVVTSIR